MSDNGLFLDMMDTIKKQKEEIENLKNIHSKDVKNLVHNETKNIDGMKFDDNKLQFGLLPPEIKLYFAEVLTFGAQKYAPDNWKKVDVKRYYDAFERHMNAFQLGEKLDSDSGLHHLKHALTNMMFICYLELNKKE